MQMCLKFSVTELTASHFFCLRVSVCVCVCVRVCVHVCLFLFVAFLHALPADWYGDVEENSTIFSLIQAFQLPPAMACGL